MDAQSYLKKLVQNKSGYYLSDEDKKTIRHEGIRKFILNKLSSSKYRAQATSPDYLQKVVDKIDLSINHQLPICVTLPFGATKNPYLPTAPGTDWAEVFTMALMREYLCLSQNK